jgi:RNA-directed DNA polymerase
VRQPNAWKGGGRGERGRFAGVRAQHRAAPLSGIDRVRKAAAERKAERFTTLLHHIDTALLHQAYHWLKRDAAAGVDGMTWGAYGEGLEARLRDLEDRIHRGSYRAKLSQGSAGVSRGAPSNGRPYRD